MPQRCSVPSCDLPLYVNAPGKGFCQGHYSRWIRGARGKELLAPVRDYRKAEFKIPPLRVSEECGEAVRREMERTGSDSIYGTVRDVLEAWAAKQRP